MFLADFFTSLPALSTDAFASLPAFSRSSPASFTRSEVFFPMSLILSVSIVTLTLQSLYPIFLICRLQRCDITTNRSFPTRLTGICGMLADRPRHLSSRCLLYTSDAADDLLCVDLGGRRIIKKKKKNLEK